MRLKLKELFGQRLYFKGTIEAFGRRPLKPRRPTALLCEVVCAGKIVCDHVWVLREHHFDNLEIGDRIGFWGTVVEYRKHYQGAGKLDCVDYNLANLNVTRLVSRRQNRK